MLEKKNEGDGVKGAPEKAAYFSARECADASSMKERMNIGVHLLIFIDSICYYI